MQSGGKSLALSISFCFHSSSVLDVKILVKLSSVLFSSVLVSFSRHVWG